MSNYFVYGSYDSEFIVVGGDGHGQETAGKRTPKLPDGTVIKENQFNHPTKLKFFEACHRCKLGVFDSSPERTDTSLSLRAQRANTLIKIKADLKRVLYMSFHCDAFDGEFGTHEGGLSVYHHPDAIMGKRLAGILHKFLVKGTKQKDRGVLKANFQILRETKMGAVLSENIFMDVLAEAMLMLNEDFQNEVAEEHCQAACEYFGVKYVEPRIIVPVKKLWGVQLGAFADKKNAETLAKELKSKGYPVYIKEVN